MPGRQANLGSYRYGFQNQETDPEMLGGAVAFKYRVHDARIGRFLSVDPLAPDYPWNSPYAFSENDLIRAIELEGLEKFILSDHPRMPGYTLITLDDNYDTESLVVVDKRKSVGANGEEYVDFPQQDMQDELGTAGVSGGSLFVPDYTRDPKRRIKFPPLVDYNGTVPNQKKPDFSAAFPVGEQISRRRLTFSGGSIKATAFPSTGTVKGRALSNQSFQEGNVQVDVVQLTISIFDKSEEPQLTSTGASVTVNNQTYTPDSNGRIILTVAPGTDFSIEVTGANVGSYQIKQETFEIVVPNDND